MYRYMSLLIFMMLAMNPVFAQDQQDPEQPEEITQEEINEISKAFGHLMGESLNTPMLQLDLESVIEGLRQGAAGKEAPMDQMEFQKKLQQFQVKMTQQLSKKNLAQADEFLSKNKDAAGVVVLESGKLQYTVLEEGQGDAVKEGGKPQIEYSGKFLDGNEFGSSEKMGRPLTIPLENTIKGFQLGLVGMKEGEKRRLWIHPELGYGTGGRLQPNALLVFDVKVVKAEADEPKDSEENESEETDTQSPE